MASTPIDYEKKDDSSVEQRELANAHSSVDYETDGGINEAKLIRKIDYRLIPVLAVLYLMSFLDRTNIGNASLFGLQTDLKLDASKLEYQTCLAVFFVTYVLFETPSNMVMKAWRPSRWIPLIMLAWGIVITLMGIVQNFTGLLVCRIFLGMTEAGLFPGVAFYLTMWYKRKEINFRTALFFAAATIAGAFGGLLARLIQLMNGTAGLEGWRWIFILEGILTVVVAVAAFFMMYDYPDTAKFLTERERAFVTARLHDDGLGLSTEFKRKFVYDAFLDWKIWVWNVMFLCCLVPVYCFSLFSPTLVANLGYTAATAQLLSVPPYILAAIMTIAIGYFSDRTGRRSPFLVLCSTLAIIGFTMCIASPSAAVGYGGVFIGAAGIYPQVPLIISLAGNNIGGSLKRAVGIAMVVSLGNCGGVISSFIYPAAERPRYFKGHGIIIAMQSLLLMLCVLMHFVLTAKNRTKERLLQQRGHAWTAEDRAKHADEGDDAPFFVYTP